MIEKSHEALHSDQIDYPSSHDWAYDLYQSQTLWLRRALLGVVALTLLLMLSITCTLCLLPLKQKVPYLYAFDHATGEITTIGTLDHSTLSSHWALSRFLLIHYVIQAESYDSDNIDQPYQMVWAQSSPTVQKQYEESVKSTNPTSPYKLYGKDKYITVFVTSISQLNDNTVDVKFEKTLHDRSSSNNQTIPKEAIIKWEYTKTDTTQKSLDRDPLGFTVTYYKVSQINVESGVDKTP